MPHTICAVFFDTICSIRVWLTTEAPTTMRTIPAFAPILNKCQVNCNLRCRSRFEEIGLSGEVEERRYTVEMMRVWWCVQLLPHFIELCSLCKTYFILLFSLSFAYHRAQAHQYLILRSSNGLSAGSLDSLSLQTGCTFVNTAPICIIRSLADS